MRRSSPTRRTRYRTLGTVTLTAVLLVATVATQASAANPRAAGPSAAAQQSWQTTISQLAKPGSGCFKATYPDVAWQKSACATPPKTPMTPRTPAPMIPQPGPRPMVVGNGDDISAKSPGGFIYNAIGSFDTVSGVISESSPPNGVGAPAANAFSLQLNTDFFVSPACAPSPNPACRGWEQFIFANDGTIGQSFIQYWLVNYSTTCPAGWWTAGIHCYRNAPLSAVVPNQPITNLANLKVSGTANPGSDSVTTFVGLTAYTTAGANYVSASGGWKIAEFGVFADGGGYQANFNAGSSVTVRTRINYGGTTAPICVAQGFTGETNNLSFGSPPPPATPPGPAILVTENTASTGTANCAQATALGDTHEHTVYGLDYDFQAYGGFVEARTGTGFNVESNKIPGLPNWPDASLNSCVGARTGSTSVVVTLGPKLYVNGTLTALGGGQLVLPGAVVNRSGNTYTVVSDSGDSMKAEVTPNYINLTVGMGTWPTTVRGLLGNPNGDVTKLEAADGTVFSAPLSFNDLYNVYGQSWRVLPTDTLLAPCSQTQTGSPSKWFFANNLPTDVHQQAQAICTRTEIQQAWINDCTLDVAVLGQTAVQAYVGLAPPVFNGNPTQ